MPKDVKLVIFDMDGLIFDTETLYLKKWFVAAEMFGLTITEDAVIASMGANRKGQEEFFLNYFGKDFPFNDVISVISELIVRDVEENGLKIKPGFRELIDFLDKKGIKKALATSTGHLRTEKYMKIAGTEKTFDTIVCGDMIANGKPAPDIFLKAAENLGVAPEKCMVLEDSANGILAACNAGMIPVCIPDIKKPSPEIIGKCYRVLPSLDLVKNEIL